MAATRKVVIALAAIASLVATAQPAHGVATGTAERKALVVYVTWVAGGGMVASPEQRTMASVVDAVGVTAKNWYKAVSRNHFPGWRATGVGPVQITTPAHDGCNEAFQGDVMGRAKAAARARGYDPANFHATVVYFTRSHCPWQGLANATEVWLNGTVSTPTVVQELGHTLALGHGLSLRCKNESGQTVPLGGKCKIVPYGDPFNAMGSGEGSFSGIQQDDLRWLSGRIRTATSDVTQYAIAPIESTALTTQVLKVPDGDGTLWIEYRRPLGVDARMPAGTEGVQIRRQMPGYGRKSILLDMTPSDSFWDARLAPGASFTSPVSKVRVTVDSVSERAANITVRMETTSRVPDVIDQTEAQAKSTLQAHNYVPRVAYQVDDPTCDDVNLVVKQSPAGGTALATGSTVTIYVAKPPPGGCDF